MDREPEYAHNDKGRGGPMRSYDQILRDLKTPISMKQDKDYTLFLIVSITPPAMNRCFVWDSAC